jgi:hypothetical protein
MTAPNIWGSSARNLLHITLLAPVILRWHLRVYVRKICAFLILPVVLYGRETCFNTNLILHIFRATILRININWLQSFFLFINYCLDMFRPQFLAICGEDVIFFSTYAGCLSAYLVRVYILGAWSRVLLEKPIGSQLVKKFPSFYGTRRFIAAFTNARHLSLSWASSFQSMPPHPFSWRSILILSYHLLLGLPSGLFPLRFSHQNPVYTSALHHTCYMPPPSHPSRFDHPHNIGWGTEIIKLLIKWFFSTPLLLRPS